MTNSLGPIKLSTDITTILLCMFPSPVLLYPDVALCYKNYRIILCPKGGKQTHNMSFNELDSDLSRSTVDLDSLSSVTSSSSDDGKESASSNVSSWTVRHVEKFLNIHYERDYLESPLAVLQKIPSLEELSEEQMIYLDRIKAYLKFDASYKMYDETYNFYTGQDGLKRTLENVVVNLNQEPGEDE